VSTLLRRSHLAMIIAATAIAAITFFFIVLDNTTITKLTNTVAKRGKSFEDVVREYLSTIKPEVRIKAIQILDEYLNSSSTIVKERLYINAGSRDYIKFHTYSFNKYRIRVYVQDTCIIGICDIKVELRDSRLNAIRYFGRRAALEYEVMLPEGDYYIYLDNSYSVFTSKTVDIAITAYFTRSVFDDEVYKMVVIALWVADNVNYVSDPRGFEYIAPPEETLKAKAGDCDDYAILLASLYRSVGLNAAVGLIDTDGDGKAEHAAALVYFTENPSTLLERINGILQVLGIETRGISYFRDGNSGIWVVVDPPMTYGSREPWYVNHRPYKLVKLIKP